MIAESAGRVSGGQIAGYAQPEDSSIKDRQATPESGEVLASLAKATCPVARDSLQAGFEQDADVEAAHQKRSVLYLGNLFGKKTMPGTR